MRFPKRITVAAASLSVGLGGEKVAMNENIDVISPAYDGVIRKSLVVQLVVGSVAALMLDGGIAARVVGVAVLGFWLCAAVIIVHRPREPSNVDLAFVHWGFWLVLAISVVRQALA